jgi:hypothetical protein
LFGRAERNHPLMNGSPRCTIQVLARFIMDYDLSLPAQFDELLYASSARAFGDYYAIQR